MAPPYFPRLRITSCCYPAPKRLTASHLSARKLSHTPLEHAIRGSDGSNLSHELKPGGSDRFIVRVEVKPHGGGTLFDHAMPGDDRMAYEVRLLIRYIGGTRSQKLTTGKVSIVSPANELSFPTTGQVRELVDEFRREVREIEDEINEELISAGLKPWNWAHSKSSKKSASEDTARRTLAEIERVRSEEFN